MVSIGDVKHLDFYAGGSIFFNPDENVGFLFDENVVAMVGGSDAYKSLLYDFDEYGPRGIVYGLMTNSDYTRLVTEHQDLEYVIANLREKPMMDVSKFENKVFSSIDYDDFDF